MARQVKNLHAPWRIEFILGPKAKNCFLCEVDTLPEPTTAAARTQWKDLLLLARTDLCTVVMNKYPYTGGHLLVSPRQHTHDYASLSDAVTNEMTRLGRLSTAVLADVMHPHGFNLGMNLGEAAGAGVKDHVHLHVIPRWTGDTNFMPLIADVTQVPVALGGLYDLLKPAFDARMKT
jgi:ATP adenylyltransferase